MALTFMFPFIIERFYNFVPWNLIRNFSRFEKGLKSDPKLDHLLMVRNGQNGPKIKFNSNNLAECLNFLNF